MNIVQNILTQNPCYTAGKKITVKGLMLHSVGCAQPKASAFIANYNKSNTKVCVHAFIDGNDGTVYQTLPWNHRGWHCGSGSKGSANNTHIGVEMCEPACINYTGGSSFTCSDMATATAVCQRTYDQAVQLFAHLCKQYGLDPLADGVIISHKEGHDRGLASGHGDPEHLWSQLGVGYTMNGFRKAVSEAMGQTSTEPAKTDPVPSENVTAVWYRVRKAWNQVSTQIGAFRELEGAKKCVDQNAGYHVFDGSGNVVYSGSAPVSEGYSKTQFIKDVQSACGATVDGIAGNETLSKTVTISASKNSKHAVVKPVQMYLNQIGYACGTADGIFGQKTCSAVIAYQTANGCVADGEITAHKTTWKKLLGLA